MHTAASPDVAFVMLVLAMSLAVFEFFTAGVGIAAGTGVVFLVLASYGLGVLPIRPWAVALLVVSMLGFGHRRPGGRAPVLDGGGRGRLRRRRARRSTTAIRSSLWVVALMAVLLALFMVSGMPAMVRTRFSTPTIGRESLIGQMGVAVSGVDPEGTVRVDGAPWRARTNRATPIAAGDAGPGGGHRRPPPRGRAGGRGRPRRRPLTPESPGHGWCGALFCPLVGRRDRGYGQRSHKGGSFVTTITQPDTAWQAKAACRGPQAAVFFPPTHPSARTNGPSVRSGPRRSAHRARSANPASTTRSRSGSRTASGVG